MLRSAIILVATLAVVAFAAGCGGTKSSNGPNSGTVRLSLTDAPADYDSVILMIREVAVHKEGPEDTGWFSFVPDSTSYDLLQLQNGVFAELGALPVPTGHYTQVRLILDPGSYVVENGVRRDIIIPSGLQTGLKLVGEWDVMDGDVVDLGIDFDASRSFHETGSGKLMLKPTVRIVVLSAPPPSVSGISGTISPADPLSIVYAISGPDTITSAIPDATGAFLLSMLAAGSYTVAIDAPAAFRDTSLAGVGVTSGQVTSLGTIALTPQ
jgi:hypothetical protein